ncbi:MULTISPECIES: bifunctional phosphoribosylaminoimidazolecarboxamide formyltransferase/IMP cyclohydrolase [Sphingomonas]|jgi:phosphoribosylaminoimidazolecarboxamide formyltransferase/IMP cyclohydrolase|uniref:Bifunctional purine biosynthesis protein PurH n=1 Tax=Sphingomonas hankookensis TaxID=563996 RepID=A0ABR5YC56_9SPHN|nr:MULTISPECIES: bifunctional phosphoribosylaminoimidazolecarboxamide formyltransferase/IMP cyclohydrolase [Sphingomonas]KZE14636.1 bifunctional phosphoribosylaminoimidazolecarboxamide formyltransferase/inosine monophosphate cyclohydrolase [Sphingomonas hankookensis]PZT92158.1 MAG: bifunctional phosphoribosylaminoimidazolecarboxamide formyltransferase/IMP cyclohydrolase PurH [Sphingomonas sp.]RSV20251.1 bifunctional phosphoribosylaminoimidazolecarboxamide formyltransferase/IMP cyclohydrolase Pur
MDHVTAQRALLSVSDKSGIVDLATALASHGVELVSTGGTASALRDAGLNVRDISELTGFPEMMDGRVKTLHPVVHGGLLAVRDNPQHVASMNEHAIGAIDIVVVNLYPFEATVAKGADRDTIIENIDIGGPSMVRSAAKNHDAVAIVTDPADYAALIAELAETGGATTLATRRRFAAKAYAATAAYDSAIAQWFAVADQGQAFPDTLPLAFTRGAELRYGENPHQSASLYIPRGPAARGIAQAEQVQGKALSYNNYNDADAALELVSEFRDGPPTVVIVKHANPCGVATGETLIEAYQAALACDSVSAFGGIIAVNRPLDGETARAISGIFTEVVAAPSADDEAKAVFAAKKNLRLLLTGELPDPARGGLMVKTIAGGLLVQSRDAGNLDQVELKVVTKRQPTSQELADCRFAWTVAKHVKSNAIVYAKGGSTAGIGAGQMNRLESARIAAWKAKDAADKAGWSEARTIGSAVASDAFFPFADGLLAAVEAGATAVIQPGGSIRDDEVIAAADEAGLAMVFTGMRHFRH